MRFDWWTFALQTVNVLILLWLLGRFLFKPAAAIVAARKAAAEAMLNEAAAARDAARAEAKKAEAAEGEIAARRADALRRAEAEAEKQKDTLLESAHADARKMCEAALQDIARARQADALAADVRAGALAVDIAGRLLDRLPAESRIAGFVPGLVQAIAALPAQTRAELGAGGAPLVVKAPRALTPQESADLERELAAALGRAARIDVVPDGRLIAGLEIEAAHARVRNSLRADLDRILASLKAEADERRAGQ